MDSWKKILIAVDNSGTSLKATAYVADMCGCSAQEICLLLVVPEPPPDYYLSGRSFSDYVKEREAEADKVFAPLLDLLLEAGVERRRLSRRAYISSHSETTSAAILEVQKEGSYGTVVVGKRGVSRTEEFLFGSISNALAQSCNEFSVWVVS